MNTITVIFRKGLAGYIQTVLKKSASSFFHQCEMWFPVSLLILLCQCNAVEQSASDFIPDFVVTDSLIIDYIGQLNLVNSKDDRSEYLLFDPQRKEFVRVNEEGNILQRKNLEEDSKDQFEPSYVSIDYLANGQLLFVGMNHFYWYDSELNLLDKKEIPFNIKSVYFSPGHANLVHGHNIFTHAVNKDLDDDTREKEDFLANFPFLTVYDFAEEKIISQDFIPKSAQMIKAPGKYMDSAPFSVLLNQDLYLLFQNSPEIYRFSFPKLNLIETIPLAPDNSFYAQIKPVPVKNYQSMSSYGMLTENSAFFGIGITNGLLLAGYHGALPTDVVEIYNSASDQEKKQIRETYKIPYYQVVKEGEKVWEGHLDIQFQFQNGRIYADRNVNLPRAELELDYVPFYFYEIR
ncbi:MAG TPA: hypothetical protein VK957_03460 [Lunatimonas sp.]|nr:hypothetical protein [Lunatimonas sp.]